MDILTQKRVTDNGDGLGYFRHSVNYIYKEKNEPDEELIQNKGYGVSDTSKNSTYDQMYAVKKYYRKTGDNLVMHFVVSYDRKTVADAETACAYTEKIAGHFKGNYQMITAVHLEDQGNSLYHAHIVMNTVNLNNGKLYHSGKSELNELAMHVHNVTGNYCKAFIKPSEG